MAEPKKPVDPKVAAQRVQKQREMERLKKETERKKDAIKDRFKKDDKKEETLPYDPVKEASMKANKLHIMHAAKLIGKVKDGEERERQAKDLEKKAKKMGFSRAEIEKILDNQGAYGEEYEMVKTREEAEKMHSYMNTLSLERSVNLWAEAAKSKEKDEDLEPIKGSKTLTKKTQEKVTINPMEKEYNRK